MGRPGEELDRLVEDPGGLEAVRELPGGHGEGAEGRVDLGGPDRGDGRTGVEEGHDIQFGLRVRAVEPAQQARGRELPADHVDAQRAPAGADGGGRPGLGLEEIAGAGQEHLPVGGEPGPARRAGEQAHAEVPLQPGDALGDGLLGDGQVRGGVLELACVGHRGEGAHGIEIHAHRP